MHDDTVPQNDGRREIQAAADDLAERLVPALAPLARLAYNYRWSWAPDGHGVFRSIDAERFELCLQNPVRTLLEAPRSVLRRAAEDRALLERVHRLQALVQADLDRPPQTTVVDPAAPGRLFVR